ncbi:cytidylyltransferase domain-containing protein [uncultured Methanobrevibacter sp.]|uniref:cytidylyltransferase domain-containing protein n=1 Tax=uncultured Methanobrevibacter sp. TaxID=253161 RepID=UPI002612B5B4|nr:UDP-2,4-diacetamido-2,4,6-trideoxy-beta-L-altropyranose hydrolase [uncultured Methanobrevibacter sp.]
MFENNKILVVIPARGYSKNIPRKNLRLLGEKPLIYYSIDIAKASRYVDDVVVSTEDSEIASIVEKYGTSVVKRPVELASDEVLLDTVIYDAMLQKEKQAFDEYDIVVTVQPSSPLLKTETLDRAIEKFANFNIDSVISVVDDKNLRWGFDEENGRYFPFYTERLYKDLLPKTFKETGGILATRRNFVTERSRLGLNIDLIEISPEESVEINTYEDWWITNNYLRKKKIAFVVDAYDQVGTGHMYRCLSMASKLVFHDVVFFVNKNHQLGIDIVNSYNYKYQTYDGKSELLNLLDAFNPHIVINDVGDTNYEYMADLVNRGYYTINFEDFGSGSDVADLVFDSLYKHEGGGKFFVGPEYYILKDEFYLHQPKIITNDVNNVLIDFAPNDNLNLSQKVLDAVLATGFTGRINVILGFGHDNAEELASKYEFLPNVQFYTSVQSISDFMISADVIFSSGGRIMYQICSLGVPCIVICKDEREINNLFGSPENGFINLGLGSYLSQEEIMHQFNMLVTDFELRQSMNEKMLNIDLKHGFEEVWGVVKSKYREFELDNSK